MGLPRGAVELRGSGGHEIRVMVGVPGPGLHLRTGLDKLRERVLADRLQEGIAGGAVRLVDLHQGAVREEGHGVQELQRMRALLPAHRLRRIEGEVRAGRLSPDAGHLDLARPWRAESLVEQGGNG